MFAALSGPPATKFNSLRLWKAQYFLFYVLKFNIKKSVWNSVT